MKVVKLFNICAVSLMMAIMLYLGNLYSGFCTLPIWASDFIGEWEKYDDDVQFSEESKELARDLLQKILGYEKGEYEHSFETLTEARRVIIFLRYDELYGVSPQCRIKHTPGGYKIVWKNGKETKRKLETINHHLDGLYLQYDIQGTEQEKAQQIMDIITEVIHGYDKTGRIRDLFQLIRSEEKNGVCTVYGALFNGLAKRAGLDSEIVIGSAHTDKKFHCWNCVKNGSERHYYDATYYANRNMDWAVNMRQDFYTSHYQEVPVREMGYKIAI